jgi:hypothetical protein
MFHHTNFYFYFLHSTGRFLFPQTPATTSAVLPNSESSPGYIGKAESTSPCTSSNVNVLPVGMSIMNSKGTPRSLLPKTGPSPSPAPDVVSSGGDLGSGEAAPKRRCVSSACMPCKKRKSKVGFLTARGTFSANRTSGSAMEASRHAMPVRQYMARDVTTISTPTTAGRAP